MKRLTALLGMTAIALIATACNHPADTHDADVLALKDNETQWNQDWQAKDADKIVSHYASDAVLMVPGTAPTSGKDAILSSLKGMVADPAMSLKFQATRVEVAKSGDLAYTQGSYTLTFTDPQTKQPIIDHGSYVTAYRKLPDGSWKAVSDIATSEVPPPAPPPAKAKKG
jgi:uncharacterized protein (TIGR02246 family)